MQSCPPASNCVSQPLPGMLAVQTTNHYHGGRSVLSGLARLVYHRGKECHNDSIAVLNGLMFWQLSVAVLIAGKSV